ncbi:hypothetical protein YC2023_005785 [Brassica napus]
MGLKKLGFTGKCIETIQGLVGNVYVTSVLPDVLSELVKALELLRDIKALRMQVLT